MKLFEIRFAIKHTDTRHYVRLSKHSKEQMKKRGYNTSDITSVLMDKDSRISEVSDGFNIRLGKNVPSYTVTGRDTASNPCVVVLSEEGKYRYSIITIMPPTDKSRFDECI